ncbi:MAG: hypothetical protein A2161_13745 [Candidatus Schekmanbacteria bacterium RBG_13_48_7]|uniref:Uncharacterized protein n=1 Tax=Candidatus Schekmanbacteria bacterium RBG_13_48_7 TaxID=1817878 RepID=A0A1F7S162_9BACT|nr:MAG: hypothetical protein A2161_13745 [Candidatus Schekmanbacteria bacterium RBG_13_48_7]
MKQRSRKEIRDLAIEIKELKDQGATFLRIGQIKDISDSYAGRVYRAYKNGQLDDVFEEPLLDDEPDEQLTELVEIISEEMNYEDYTNVMLYERDPKESIIIKVLTPETNNVDEFNKLIELAVLNKIKWCYQMQSKIGGSK